MSLNCVTVRRMATKKKANTHTSTRKKASASPRRAKKATKTSKSTLKSKAAKKLDEEKRLRKRIQLTLKVFRMAYEANQRGEFHSIFR